MAEKPSPYGEIHLQPGRRLRAVHTRMRSLAWRAGGGEAPGGPGFRIVSYDRVADDRDGLAVSPRRLAEQLDALAGDGYRGVDVLTALDAAPGAVGLAFEGGSADVAEQVLPELERHGFGATVFLATGITGGRAVRSSPRLLSWEDVATLDRGALCFEALGVASLNLRAVDDAQAWAEIAGSKRELEERLGRDISVFCYPGGLFGEREARLVARAGFRAACTAEPGLNTDATDPFRLRRIRVGARDSVLDFRARVAGALDTPWLGRRRR